MDTPPIEQGNHARVSDPATWPEHIRARYGIRSRRQRVVIVAAILVGVLALPFATRFAWRASSQQGVLSMSAFRVLDDTHIDADLLYAPKAEAFTCAIRAQDSNRVDVGYAYLVLRPESARSQTYRLATRAPAVFAGVLGCQPGVATDRLPPPQFAPGVKPPAQPPPGITPRSGGGFATVRP